MSIVDDPKLVEEVWESTTGGAAHVWTKDPQNTRNWIQKKRAGGPGNPKLRLTVEEREYNQDLVAWGNDHLDPFKNGMLRRISPESETSDEGVENQYSNEDLIKLVTVGSDSRYSKIIRDIESEVVLRRMVPLAQKHASNLRWEEIKAVVKERFPVNLSTDGGFDDEQRRTEDTYSSALSLR